MIRFRIPPDTDTRADDVLTMLAVANPGWRIERDGRDLLAMSPTGGLSGAHGGALLKLLQAWSETVEGIVFDSSTGFTMPDGSVLSPDASWMSLDRWEQLPYSARIGYPPLVPEICIEIVSAWDSLAELRKKVSRYREFGAEYVLLIDPFNRTVESEGTRPDAFPSDFASVFDIGS